MSPTENEELAPEVAEPGGGAELEDAEEDSGLDSEARERRLAALSLVHKFGDPVLRSEASPVSDFDSRLAEDAERMVKLMQDAVGVGLAATQLGSLRRLLVFQAGYDATPTALVNPATEWISDQVETAEEGCLSLPGIIVEVERPLHARVRGQDLRGETITVEASGLEARVLQHEIDHLNGVLILDRTPREQRRAAIRALREGTSWSPDALEGTGPAPDGHDGDG